ncbi:hypothetical protein SteCoe_17146 [Stentor coeruleus]|uniref:Uncharacterized protein n=1 Tax=Stentor coeruleus TaxID=5963 RepID=A0A1R2BZH6_9CILI|nr:hypothetical protein SteCoe_17146 [Stentor coeruleus]
MQDSNIEKTNSDGERTEFLANARFLFPEEKKVKKEKHYENVSKTTMPKPINNITMSTQSFELLSSATPILEKINDKKSLIRHERIYSSNMNFKGVNIIEKMKKSQSLCSTNVNSRIASRCVSPHAKIKSAYIE